MKDLFFRYDLTIGLDVEDAIEMRAGEILTGVPDDLAARLLRRPDVSAADPGADARRVTFAAPRRVAPALAALVSPPLDESRLAEDEERAGKLAEVKRKRASRLRAESEASKTAA